MDGGAGADNANALTSLATGNDWENTVADKYGLINAATIGEFAKTVNLCYS